MRTQMEEAQRLMLKTNIKEVLGGDTTLSPILQCQELTYLQRGHCYRAYCHDSRLASDKFCFSAALNRKVQEVLVDKHSVIKVTKFKLYNNQFVFVQQFEVLFEFSKEVMISNPYLLNEKDYEKILQKKRNVKLPSSPGKVDKKLTSRYVDLCKTPKVLRK